MAVRHCDARGGGFSALAPQRARGPGRARRACRRRTHAVRTYGRSGGASGPHEGPRWSRYGSTGCVRDARAGRGPRTRDCQRPSRPAQHRVLAPAAGTRGRGGGDPALSRTRRGRLGRREPRCLTNRIRCANRCAPSSTRRSHGPIHLRRCSSARWRAFRRHWAWPVAHGSRRGWATFLVGAAVGATTYGTVAHLQQRSRTPQTPAMEIAPRPPEPAPSLPETQPRPAVEGTPRPAAAPTSPQRVLGEQDAGKVKDQGLAAERKWIEMARTALVRGRADGALAALHHHGRLHPNGQLAEERDRLLIQTLVAKGDYVQARAQVARFGRRHPHSLSSPAIEQALQSIP